MNLSRRTDLATVAGLLIAGCGLYFGLKLEGIQIYDIGQATAALIVFCGTAGAVLISMPLAQTKQALKTLPAILRHSGQPETEVIEEIIRYARLVRTRGLLAVDQETESIRDPYFRRGMRLAVDAVGPDMMKNVLEADIAGLKAQAESAAVVFETAAGYAPTLGVAGAAIGLVQVMKHLDHIEQVGVGVAAAFVATIYGVLLANLVLLPIATKIRAQAEYRARTCGLLREGVLSIAAGLNPALIRLKLEALAQLNDDHPSERTLRAKAA